MEKDVQPCAGRSRSDSVTFHGVLGHTQLYAQVPRDAVRSRYVSHLLPRHAHNRFVNPLGNYCMCPNCNELPRFAQEMSETREVRSLKDDILYKRVPFRPGSAPP